MATLQDSFGINLDPHRRVRVMINDMYTHTNKFDADADHADTARASDTVRVATVPEVIACKVLVHGLHQKGKPYLTSSLTGAP